MIFLYFLLNFAARGPGAERCLRKDNHLYRLCNPERPRAGLRLRANPLRVRKTMRTNPLSATDDPPPTAQQDRTTAMQLFYAPDITPPLHTLSEEESKHCVRVLRLACGDTLHITDGRGDLHCCEIVDDNPRRCTVRVVSTQHQFEKLPYALTMACAPTRMPNASNGSSRRRPKSASRRFCRSRPNTASGASSRPSAAKKSSPRRSSSRSRPTGPGWRP